VHLHAQNSGRSARLETAMTYRTLLAALAVTLPAVACAAHTTQPASDSSSATDTEDKVACITDFIGSELDASQHDAFIEDCMQKKIAARKNPVQKNG
jgi:hypothetical protein